MGSATTVADMNKMCESYMHLTAKDVKDAAFKMDYTQLNVSYGENRWGGSLPIRKEDITEVLCPVFNRTSSPQKQKLQETTKVRHLCKVDFKSALLLNGEVNMPLQLPQTLWKSGEPATVNIRGGMHAEFYTERDSTLASDITVAPGKKLTARLTVQRETCHGEFFQEARLVGTIKIDVYKDGVYNRSKEVNMRELIDKLKNKKPDDCPKNITDNKAYIDGITVQIAGKAVFEFYDKAEVDLCEEAISTQDIVRLQTKLAKR